MSTRRGLLWGTGGALNIGGTVVWASRRPRGAAAHGGPGDYIRVSEWAKANDFTVQWVRKDEALQLSRPSASILLNVDSNEAEVNGVGVRLCFPVAHRDGAALFSQTDAR